MIRISNHKMSNFTTEGLVRWRTMEVGLFRVTFLVISRLKSRPYETFRQMAINLLMHSTFCGSTQKNILVF